MTIVTNRRILQGMVERWGMKPTAVCDGEQALVELSAAEESERCRTSLILTDMHMPKMDGFGLVEQIKRAQEQSTCDDHDADLRRPDGRCSTLRESWVSRPT